VALVASALTTGNIASSTGPASYETFFAADETPISEGGKWRSLSTDLTRVNTGGGLAFGTQNNSLGFDDSYAFLDAAYLPIAPDQYVEATIYKETGFTFTLNQEVECILRCSDAVGSPGVRTWYEILWNKDGGFEILYLTGIADNYTPMSTTINNSLAPSTGDIFRGECTEVGADTLIVGRVNGTIRVQATITGASFRIPTGQPGMAFFNRNASSTGSKFCYSRVKVGAF
jgi:hypothetical protein